MNFERLVNSKWYQTFISIGYLLLSNIIAVVLSIVSAGVLFIPAMLSLTTIVKHTVDDHTIQLVNQFVEPWKSSFHFVVRYTLTLLFVIGWWTLYGISVALWISGGDYLWTAWMFAGFGVASALLTGWMMVVSLLLHLYFPLFGVKRLLLTSALVIRKRTGRLLLGYAVILAVGAAIYFAPYLVFVLPVYGFRGVILVWNSLFSTLAREEADRMSHAS